MRKRVIDQSAVPLESANIFQMWIVKLFEGGTSVNAGFKGTIFILISEYVTLTYYMRAA